MSIVTLRASVRATAFLAVVGFLIVTYPIACALGLRARHAVRRFWSRYTCWLLGIKVRANGAAFSACPTLFVANHVSYLDVVILGSFLDATFIAKAEVNQWPLFGYIARVTGTLFIRRYWRDALIQRDLIVERMRQDESFVLFPEGTSSNGLGVKPFKTTLLSVAEPKVLERPIAVQGVTLAYRCLADGEPFSPANCDLYAWYDDMEFLPHLWEALKRPGAVVEVHFHEPVLSWSISSRKVLGPALHREIAGRLADLRGHTPPVTAAPAAATRELPQPAAE